MPTGHLLAALPPDRLGAPGGPRKESYRSACLPRKFSRRELFAGLCVHVQGVCVCVFSVCARGVCVASVMREVCACEASVHVHVHTCVDLLVDTCDPYKW